MYSNVPFHRRMYAQASLYTEQQNSDVRAEVGGQINVTFVFQPQTKLWINYE